ncbi:MAG: hypothetical protein J1E62_08230 [Lachnospiraceae bacterium]|nr:hypothetical protein [Lachnospiraceae bacterium]
MKIKMKPRAKQNEDQWIGELLDQVDEEKLLEMSAIHSDIPLPVPNQEKLAQSVIDKADLADEKELERRRAFEKAYRRKQFIRGCIGVGCVAVVLAVLALCGVFDNVLLKKYSYQLEAAVVAGGVPAETSPQFEAGDVLRQSGFNHEDTPKDVTDKSKPAVNMDALDNTVYDAAAQYCEKNHYAVDECEILRSWYHTKNGKTVVMCEMATTFMRLDEGSVGQGLTSTESDWHTIEPYLHMDLSQLLLQQNLNPDTGVTDSTGGETASSQQKQNVSEKQGIAIFLLSVDVNPS